MPIDSQRREATWRTSAATRGSTTRGRPRPAAGRPCSPRRRTTGAWAGRWGPGGVPVASRPHVPPGPPGRLGQGGAGRPGGRPGRVAVAPLLHRRHRRPHAAPAAPPRPRPLVSVPELLRVPDLRPVHRRPASPGPGPTLPDRRPPPPDPRHGGRGRGRAAGRRRRPGGQGVDRDLDRCPRGQRQPRAAGAGRPGIAAGAAAGRRGGAPGLGRRRVDRRDQGQLPAGLRRGPRAGRGRSRVAARRPRGGPQPGRPLPVPVGGDPVPRLPVRDLPAAGPRRDLQQPDRQPAWHPAVLGRRTLQRRR